MFSGNPSMRRRAVQMLLLATFFWGLSFPTMKALGMVQQRLLPEASSWFITANTIAVRFGLAALIVFVWSWPTLKQITRSEVWQGLGLGLFGGAGLFFQMDGLAYTSASTSAFLTQCYCLILPLVVAFRERRAPSGTMIFCSIMVIVGVALLADIDWRTIRLGRGELESLLGSIIFTAQILWLERPVFARNRANHFSLIMFATMTGLTLPIALGTSQNTGDWITAYSSGSVIGLMMILVLLCTMIAYMMMNHWQPYVAADEAGLVYCAEPVFASLFALFLPAWISSLANLNYSNETLTWSLLLGGGLISGANVVIQLKAAKTMAGQQASLHEPTKSSAANSGLPTAASIRD